MSSVAYSKCTVASSIDVNWLPLLCMNADDDMYRVYEGNCSIGNGEVTCRVPHLYEVGGGAPDDDGCV